MDFLFNHLISIRADDDGFPRIERNPDSEYEVPRMPRMARMAAAAKISRASVHC